MYLLMFKLLSGLNILNISLYKELLIKFILQIMFIFKLLKSILCLTNILFTSGEVSQNIHQNIDEFRIVGWYNGDQAGITNIPWDKYTHIVTGTPIQYSNGSIACNHNDTITQTIVELAHENNRVVQWRNSVDVIQGVFNRSAKEYRDNFFNSLLSAMDDCNIDGIEFDFEWHYRFLDKIGIVLPKYADMYTDFLANVKSQIPNRIVSADIGVWGCCDLTDGYPLGITPWINATKFNAGAFDFVNSMSYHHPKNLSIDRWFIDAVIMDKLWKFNLSNVNLGVPYFSVNSSFFKINSEPTWASYSHYCPNMPDEQNICNGITFVGKELNYMIGYVSVELGFGGVFPWTLNYDSFENNNTLIDYLYNGIYRNI